MGYKDLLEAGFAVFQDSDRAVTKASCGH